MQDDTSVMETAAVEPVDEPLLPEAGALRLALLESRQRWRQFGAIATDMAFETDGDGNITFMAPDWVLGHHITSIVGQPGIALLADPAGPNPFLLTGAVRRLLTWMRAEGGDPVCMALTLVPMLDEAGRQHGLRGIGVNVTEQERAHTATASALRRGEVLSHILSQMRQEVMAPRMMRAMLEAIMRALGCGGVLVVDLTHIDPPVVLHQTGAALGTGLQALLPLLASGADDPRPMTLGCGSKVLACPCSTRFGERVALLAWRAPEQREWDGDDIGLAASVSGAVRIVLEHESIQRELAKQARTDPLTGLLNRRAFIEEATRRLDRLERDGQPGTLLFIDLDRLKQLNDRCGHEAGDAALVLVSALLHRTFRPTDLIARLGGDEFAVWLDGADSLTAAERAESLRLSTPGEMAHLTVGDPDGMSMSIGIATREPGHFETLTQLIQRADQAMYDVKRNGRGHWLVSHLALPQ